MPHMNGIEFLDKLRKWETDTMRKSLPALILSGHSNQDFILQPTESFKSYASDVIMKPVSRD